MRKLRLYLFALVGLLMPHLTMAQVNTSVMNMLKDEQLSFARTLKGNTVDTAIVNPLAIYCEKEINTIAGSILTNAQLADAEKEKGIRSLAFFLKEMNKSVAQQKIIVYEIPLTIKYYKEVLTTIIARRPFALYLAPASAASSQLVASAFFQYPEYAMLDDIAVFKRVSSSPQFIFPFLVSKPGFRFGDSLLVIAAVADPKKLLHYKDSPGIKDRFARSGNIYLKQLVYLAEQKNASELLPFVIDITDNKVNTDSILNTRMDVSRYFALLVNSLSRSILSKDSNSIFLNSLRKGIKDKSLSFYVEPINEQHSEPDAKRFLSIKGLRPIDLYYVMTECGEELYTSSYLGLYKRLMENFKGNADSLFELVKDDNFHTFIRLAANYNTLADFLGNIPVEKRTAILHRFISGIEADYQTALARAMDIGDCFTSLATAPEIGLQFYQELQSNLYRCQSNSDYLGIRLYGILLRVFDLVWQRKKLDDLWATLGNYDVLKYDALKSKNDEVVELVLFYGDEDGEASFNSFLKLYADSSKWSLIGNANWVNVRSNANPSLSIYANRPLDEENDLDLKAQDSLFIYFKQQSLDPAILVHRGHSYHLDKTLKRLSPSVKLAILGSCGSFNKAISLASLNSDIQVIGSKKTGAKSINDPLIDVINEALLNKKDLTWNEIWNQLESRFGQNGSTMALFQEYIPPNNNLSLFVLKLFLFYNGFA